MVMIVVTILRHTVQSVAQREFFNRLTITYSESVKMQLSSIIQFDLAVQSLSNKYTVYLI